MKVFYNFLNKMYTETFSIYRNILQCIKKYGHLNLPKSESSTNWNTIPTRSSNLNKREKEKIKSLSPSLINECEQFIMVKKFLSKVNE